MGQPLATGDPLALRVRIFFSCFNHTAITKLPLLDLFSLFVPLVPSPGDASLSQRVTFLLQLYAHTRALPLTRGSSQWCWIAVIGNVTLENCYYSL